MHIICSNFGSIQPESNVAVWSTSAKPAMSASQALCGFSQDSWDVAGHVGILTQSLKGMWQDICTSIKEIGTLSQTFIYVRYPYHMGERLQKLCKVLSTVSVENHKFSAKVVTEGRAKLHHSGVDVKPWQLQINGHKLAALDAEEITAATKMQPATCEENFLKVMAQHTYHLGFHKSIAGECQSAVETIWNSDWKKSKHQQGMEVCSDAG